MQKFFESNIEEAFEICQLAKKRGVVDEDFLVLESMLCYLLGNVLSGIWVGDIYRHKLKARGEESALATFLVLLGNSVYRNLFFKKTGKMLELFDGDVVYSTEDEVFVPRSEEKPPPSYSDIPTVDAFWLCVVNGSEEAIDKFLSDYPRFTDERISDMISHKTEVMKINNRIVNRIKKEDSVLDLGSGAGMLAYMLFENGKYDGLTLVDINSDKIERSKHHADNYLEGHSYDFVVGDILDSDWLRTLGTFDVITAIDLVEHLYNAEFDNLFDTVMDMLNDGGRFYIQTPNGVRYLGQVVDEEGNIIQNEFLGKISPHVSERSVGYYKKKLIEEGHNAIMLGRDRIILEVLKKRYVGGRYE